MIKYEEKTFVVVDYVEIKGLINKTFGVDFVDNEARNGSYYELGNIEIDHECEEENEFRDGEFPTMTLSFIQLLINRGLVKPGNYLLRVCW